MRSTRSKLLAGVAAVLMGSLMGCTTAEPEKIPASPYPIPVAIADVGQDFTIGVIASLTSPDGQGADWRQAAEGAQVAAYRLKLANVHVTIKAADDKGNAAGAAAAVNQLTEAGATAIVVASKGDHVRGAIDEAAKTGISVLLPYETDPTVLAASSWLTGPGDAALQQALSQAISLKKASQPLVIDAGVGTPAGMTPVGTIQFAPGGNVAAMLGEVAGYVGENRKADVIVIAGSAAQQAVVVRALQGADIDVPVVLTHEAVSPAFATALGADGGTLAGNYVSVGSNSGDAVAMQPDNDGQAMSAYLASVRAAAADASLTDLFDGKPFSTVAAGADVGCHDAVIALAAAAGRAKTTAPKEIAGTLATMKLGHSDGIAGPALNFTTSTALPAEAVVTVQASTQDPGLRPVVKQAAARLFWFKTLPA